MISQYSKKIYSFMLRELNIMGPYHIDRVCRRRGINPHMIEERDMPYVVKALSNVVMAYKGKSGARAFVEELRSVYDPKKAADMEKEMDQKVEHLLHSGDVQCITDHIPEALQRSNEAVSNSRFASAAPRADQLQMCGLAEIPKLRL